MNSRGASIGSLFSGYGGLDLGVMLALGNAEPVWHAEIDPAACRVLESTVPGVPNLGDVTTINFTDVEPVDILTGGFPCQDLSHAGKRAGLSGERSGLWSQMVRAVETMRPGLVVVENVRGILSASADRDVEWCPWCVGGAGDEHSLRALGAVLGDLADLRYDAAWVGLRAADVGAPHARYRVFVVAWPDADPQNRRNVRNRRNRRRPLTADDRALRGGTSRAGWARPADDGDLTLLPTPVVNDMGAGKSVAAWDEWTATMRARHGNGNGHGPSLAVEALRMLPTPRATDGSKGGPNQRGTSGDLMLPSAVQLMPTPTAMDLRASGGNPTTGTHGTTLTDATVRQADRFGRYAEAVARWEALTRPAPDPTEPTGRDGRARLAPVFVEWLMGLPEGWVTDLDLPYAAQLRLLGNGVVPQQAAAAIGHLLDIQEAVA